MKHTSLVAFAATMFMVFSPVSGYTLGTYTVTNTNDSGAGSLRNGIDTLNSSPAGSYVLNFAIPAGSTISVSGTTLATIDSNPISVTNDSGGTITISTDIPGDPVFRADASITFGGASALNILANVPNSWAYAIASDTSNLLIGSISNRMNVSAQAGKNSAFGLYSDEDITITGGMAGTISATAGTHTAVGIQSGGTLNGGTLAMPLVISGNVSATANGLAVAVASVDAMNLKVTGTLSGVDTSGGGAGYAIRAGASDGAGGWTAGVADNAITLGTGANLVGIVDLGSGNNTLTVVGSGSASNTFLGVTSLVAGDGTTSTNWTLNPSAANASSFGSLTINANAALSINEYVTILGNTVNNGSLTFDIATTKTYSGIISGSGSVTKAGPGILYLRGDNTYTGGTSLTGGILDIVSDANLGAPSGTLTFSGGTLRTSAPLTMGRAITVNAGGGTLDNAGNALTLNGSISGSGPFALTGSGTVTMAGNGSGYSGSATLLSGRLDMTPTGSLGGTLTVNPLATLGGRGTLGNLTNNGLVSPGGSIGTLNVSGNYVQGARAVYFDEIDPSGRGDLLNVSGTAQLIGGLLVVSAPIVYYPTGALWPVITAAGGQTGGFASVVQDFPSSVLHFQPVSTASGTTLVAMRTPYAAFATNGRAASVGQGLTKGAFNATGALTNIILAFDLASASTIANSLNQMHPEPYDAYTQSGFDSGRMITAAIQGRLNTLRTGEALAAFSSPFDSTPAQDDVFNALTQSPPLSAPLDAEHRMGVFLQPFGMTARQGSTGGRTAYGYTCWGMLGGLDFALSRNFVAGLFGSYADRNLALAAPASDTGRASTTSLGGYASYFGERWFAESSLRFGLDAYNAKRTVSSPIGSSRVSASWSGWNTSANVGTGYSWHAAGWVFGPVGALEFSCIAQDGYGESGAGPLGLKVHPRADASLHSSLGVKIARPMEFAKSRFIPEVRMSWGHEWLNGSRDIVANLQGYENTGFTTKTVPPASDWAAVSAALTIQCTNRFSLTVRASTDLFRPEYQTVAGSLGLRYTF